MIHKLMIDRFLKFNSNHLWQLIVHWRFYHSHFWANYSFDIHAENKFVAKQILGQKFEETATA